MVTTTRLVMVTICTAITILSMHTMSHMMWTIILTSSLMALTPSTTLKCSSKHKAIMVHHPTTNQCSSIVQFRLTTPKGIMLHHIMQIRIK